MLYASRLVRIAAGTAVIAGLGCHPVRLRPGSIRAIPGDTQSIFEALTRQRLRAIVRCDRRTWESLIDDSASLTYYDGRVLNKAQAAAAILPCDTSLAYDTEDSVSIADINVRMLSADLAIVTDASIERYRVDSLRLAWRYAETAVYRRRGTEWRLVALEGAMVPSRPKLLPGLSSTGGNDDYAGRYALSPTYFLDIVVEGDHLIVQGPRYEKRRWRASARNIFVPDTGANRSVWIFEQDSNGHISAVTLLDFGGSSSRFARVTR